MLKATHLLLMVKLLRLITASSEAGHDMDSENVDMEAHFAEANYNYFEEEYANLGKEDWDDFEKDYKKFANADWAPADCNDFDKEYANFAETDFNDFEEEYRKFAEADCNDFQEEHTYVEEAGCNDFEDENTGFAEAEGLNNKLDEFRKIMDTTFGSEVEAYMFYNKYARDHGFSNRKGKVKRAKSSETIRLRHFVCSRAGKRAKKFLAMEGRIRRPRAESRCRCEAKLTIKLDRLRGIWYVGKFVDDHSHPLARPDEIPFLRSHRRIKDFQKAEILAMGAAGIRKHQIMDTLERRCGGYDKVGFIRRDIYNFCSRQKRSPIAKGDAMAALGIMKSRKERDPDFFFEYQVDVEGCLKTIFWCDTQSRMDYQDFGDVVVFDSTYRLNMYKMPFVPFVGLNNHRSTTIFGCGIVSDESVESYVWLLRAFMKAMCQKKPRSIITDGDNAVIRALRQVVPNVKPRICSWHIERDIKKNLYFNCLTEFRSLLYYASSSANFEERWNSFVTKHQTERNKVWLEQMYKKKKLWAASFVRHGYFLGMQSNQRSESLNSCLHRDLDMYMSLVDLIKHYENCICRIRRPEASNDCAASQSMLVAVTDCKEMEGAASHIFTPANFYILQEYLKKVDDFEIFDTLVDINSQSFIVASKNQKKWSFLVDYDLANSEASIKCSCKKMERSGLPCVHILHVLKHLKLSEIPKCCVLRRLSKDAKGSLPSTRKSDLFVWSDEQRSRYNQLTVLGAEAFHVASNNPEVYKKLREYLQGIISKKQMSHIEVPNSRNSVDQASQNCERASTKVRDPIRIATKGAPKQKATNQHSKNSNGESSQRLNGFDEKEKTQQKRCSLCQQTGHNMRTCEQNPKFHPPPN